MTNEHRHFVVLYIHNNWAVFHLKKKVSSEFKTKLEAEEYKKYLKSR